METALAVAPAQPSFSVGAVIGRTFSAWSKNLVPFATLAAIVNAPPLAVALWSQYAISGGYPRFQPAGGPIAQRAAGGFAALTAPFFAVWLVTMFLMVIQMGALTYGAIQHLAGRKVSFAALVGVGLRHAWRVFLAGIVCLLMLMLATVPLGFVAAGTSGVVAVLAMIPFGVIAIALLCGIVAAIPAAVAESKGPIAAVRRSFALTKGRRFAIFVAFLVMTLVIWILAAVTGFLPAALGSGTASLVGAFVVQAITTPLWTLLPAVAYHDLRIEKEGVDTAELAKVFE